MALYRITQEAVTDRKHAPGSAVAVHVSPGYAGTRLLVVDTAPGSRSAASPVVPSGYGLVGVRERVSALDRHLEMTATDDGGWRLTAALPRAATGPGPGSS